MSESAAAPQPVTTVPDQPRLSEGQRLINVFIEPSKTFTDLKRKASWIVPYIILSIAAYALIGVVAQKVGWEQVTQNQMRMNQKRAEQFDQLPADQRAQRMAISVSVTKYISYAWPVMLLLFTVIIAGILMATFNFGLGAEVPFGLSLAIVMYASLPEILRVVLAIISLYAGASPESFIFQNPVACNLGAFVDAIQHPVFYALGSAVDIFKFWSLILTGIGFACVSKVKRGAAMAVTFGWYALVTLIGAGITAAFS